MNPRDSATLAAALAVWASAESTGPTRLYLRRHPRFAEAMKALDGILAHARKAASDAAEHAYRVESFARFNAIPPPLRSRQSPDPPADRLALARELSPFGEDRVRNAIDDARRALERAALEADPPKAIGRWLGDHGPRLARAVDGFTGDAATDAIGLAADDLIDARFRD